MSTATVTDPHADLASAREDLADLPTLQALVGDRELAIRRARKDGVTDLANLTNLEANANAARSLLTRHERDISELQARVIELEAQTAAVDLEATIAAAAIAFTAARDAHAKAVDGLAASVAKYAATADERLQEALAAGEEAHNAATAWTERRLGPGNHDSQNVRRTYAGALKSGGFDASSLESKAGAEGIYRHAAETLAPTISLIRTVVGKDARWP